MDVIQTLFERDAGAKPHFLDRELRVKYGGDLQLPAVPNERPCVVANFVSTLDGVVSFNIPGRSGGAAISGTNPGDRFIMGLLRASADAVLVGSGTVAAVHRTHLWVAEYIHPEAADLYAKYRQTLGKAKYPLTAIVSGTGQIDLDRAVFHTLGIKVLVVTTEQGRTRLLDAGVGTVPSITIRTLAASDGKLTPAAILEMLKNEFGAALVLHEGGPTLFGQFLAGGHINELFLTLAPQIAGRLAAQPRPGLVMNTEFVPDTAPWFELLSVKRAGRYLYLRYGLAKRHSA